MRWTGRLFLMGEMMSEHEPRSIAEVMTTAHPIWGFVGAAAVMTGVWFLLVGGIELGVFFLLSGASAIFSAVVSHRKRQP